MKQASMALLGLIILITAATSFAGDCGDVNNDGSVNILDIVYLIDYKYKGGLAPDPQESADVNSDGNVDILDIVYLINYKYKSGPDPDCPSYYTTPATTTIIPPEETTVIQDYDDITGNITLDESSVYAQGVSVGDVIIGQDDEEAPYGFLRKVTSKTTQGGTIVLETEQATMMEAFETMDISETHQLRPSDVKSYRLYNGAEFNPNRGDDTFAIPLDCVFYDDDGNLLTTDDQIRINGEYKFTAALFANIEMSWFTLQKFETEIKTNENVSIDLTVGLKHTFSDEEKELAEFQLGAYPIGGVVWIVPTLTVKAYISGDLTLTIVTGITYTQELRNGFGYANNVYYDISESTKEFIYLPPQFTAEFNFEPGLSLDVALLLYGVVGPYVGAKAGLNFQSVLSPDPCNVDLTFGLYAILYATVGAKCDILDLDYSNDYPLYIYPIVERIYDLGGSGTIVIDAEPNSLNAPWSLAGPCSYSTSGSGDNTLTSLDPGDYMITWGVVSGWTAPSNSTLALVAGQTVTFSGTYIEETGTGTIVIDPFPDVLNAPWSLAGPDSYSASGTGDETLIELAPGDYTVTWGPVSGWITPSNSVQTLTASQTVTFSGTYVEEVPGTVTDYDGNVYQTVTIGTQVWMAENLKVTHYCNGVAIPNETNGTTWATLTTGAYCEYNNDGNNVATYGRLYNWYAVNDSRKIAPIGWHVPTDAEWQILINYLGGDAVAGGKMKEAGTAHWYGPNTGATNESGFSGLPGGGRFAGSYLWMRSYAYFWSSTQINNSLAWPRGLYYARSDVRRDSNVKQQGFSVRCVKD